MSTKADRTRLTARRGFLRVVGGVGISSLVAPNYLLGAEKSPGTKDSVGAANDLADGVLVETAGFDNLGGWKLDTQHYQQMGGCYLLAHGMGEPVADASTRVSIPEAGTWHVWVRTRDWCPGQWASPGRFQLLIDGRPLEPIFGTENAKWHWQSGGTITVETAGDVEVTLHDLTGFDGRCDAVFFSRSPQPELPGDDLKELVNWKDVLSGRSTQRIGEDFYDLVVVGGGIAGCAAALAAKSQGLRVALIQDRPVFGGNASEEIRVHTLGIHGYGSDILGSIDTQHYPNGDARAAEDQRKREATMLNSGVELYAGHIACGLSKSDGRINSVEARDSRTGVIRRFHAPRFIDATGDGWLGYWAGAEFRTGREAYSEFGEQWEKHGDLWSPESPDQRVMGSSVLWNTERTKQRQSFPDVPWALPVANGHRATEGEWYWEYSDNDLDQIDDAEQIRDHMLRAIYGSFANAKKHPKNATVRLKWVAFVSGKRESRRLMGDHIYTMHDAAGRKEFPDAVVVERRAIDSHYQRKLTGARVDFLSEALFYRTGGDYFVPFRSLYSKDVDNLMMAGRCFSCSHIGLAGPRVMNTCGQMGIATGYAAALCKKYDTDPRAVGHDHIQELRKLIGIG